VPDHGSDVDASHARGVYIGEHGIQTNITVVPRQEISWPVRCGTLPPLAACLQPRDEQLAALPAPGEAGTVILTQILSGLGGVGKTQLAAGIAHHRWHHQQVDLLVWVAASSRDAIIGRYAETARRLGIDGGLDGEAAAGQLLDWLAGTTNRWLSYILS
jgi:hypothetical protein